MKLSKLLQGIRPKEIIGQDRKITNLSHDSKTISDDGLFFCLQGEKTDGHDFVYEALKNGATAIISQKVFDDIDITQVIVDDTRSAMSIISANFYDNPAKSMRLIGVTGTNGKTTTTYIIKSIGEAAGKKVGLIGTSGTIIDGKTYPPTLTTPDPIELHSIFRQMADCDTNWVVMEVSAHAIELKKIDGFVFDVAVFTNCTQDHLDFFKTIENYRQAKSKLFCSYYAKLAVINSDDELGRKICQTSDIPCFTYGCKNPSDAFGVNYSSSFNGLKYVINIFDKLYEINFALPGKFNMYNTLCAALTCYILNVSLYDIAAGIKNLKTVKGRFETYIKDDKQVIIDYAHTPDGLVNILYGIKEFAKGKIITVFGCGGNRDKDKRAKMGKAVCSLSDYTVITSDNPRFEKPEDIIYDIEQGAKQTRGLYTCIPDRKQAIKHAISLSQKDDIILIAGKGDESYQEIKGVKYPFSDLEVVKNFIKNTE
ncbi:MAG TPA: UDP-N-acetylmuramoyl-L-alanyl-D-glutamate--2,6-diaminopimelate ligase [Clostridiales bacterium]|nr:UDP-N-acetylmuramoyl-L-alanyl-D-glutamate--2,6-diaminopimelate ligase [Clostridiales bacterium]